MAKRKIGSLEKQSDIDNPSWIPRPGEYYAWRENNTRHGELLICQVIDYDTEKKIVHGREPSSMRERRHFSGVFKVPNAIAEALYKWPKETD